MKPVVIIAIAVGVSVVAVLGVLIGIGVYQQAQLEKEQREANPAFIDLMKKVAKSEQKQPTTQTKENNCDPSYPDFCIPPPPPDLDCKDIPQKRFTVLPPDPHRFD